MKKTIVMTIIFVMVLLSFANIVKANTAMTVSMNGSKKVKKGDTVTVTVTASENVNGAHFFVKYDKKLLKYASSTALAANDDSYGDGVDLEFINTNGTKTFTITFNVIGEEGKTTITAEPTLFTAGTTEADKYDVSAITGGYTVEIEKAVAPTPTPTANPTPTPTQAPTSTSTANPTPTQAPKQFPKTGFDVAPIAVAGLGLSLIAIVARLRKINK